MPKQEALLPPAELAKIVARAKADALSADQLADLLPALRRGEPAAREAILRGVLAPILDFCRARCREFQGDVWASIWLAAATAVDRLAQNTAPDALKYILDELPRGLNDHFRAERIITPEPSSTWAERKQREKAAGIEPKKREFRRLQKRPKDDDDIEFFWGPMVENQAVKNWQQKEREPRWQEVTKDSEMSVMIDQAAGYSIKQTADRNNMTADEIERLVERIQDRARRQK